MFRQHPLTVFFSENFGNCLFDMNVCHVAREYFARTKSDFRHCDACKELGKYQQIGGRTTKVALGRKFKDSCKEDKDSVEDSSCDTVHQLKRDKRKLELQLEINELEAEIAEDAFRHEKRCKHDTGSNMVAHVTVNVKPKKE